MFMGSWQFGIIVAAIALVLLGLILIPGRRRRNRTRFGVISSNQNGLEPSFRHSDSWSSLKQQIAEAAFIADCDHLNDSGETEIHPETAGDHVARTKRNLVLRGSDSWCIRTGSPLSDNATHVSSEDISPNPLSGTNNIEEPDGNPSQADEACQTEDAGEIPYITATPVPGASTEDSHAQAEDNEDAKDRKYAPIESSPQTTEGPKKERLAFLNRLTGSPCRLREGGSHMLNLEKYRQVQTVCLKVERVIGTGAKQVLLEETKTIPGIKIVEIIPTLTNMRSIVKDCKVIIQGTVHKQIFFIGTDELEHHLAEDMDFSELVHVEPLDPMFPVREGMNQQDFSVIENSVFEFDPDTGALTQKIVLGLSVKVTETQQLMVSTSSEGIPIKARVVVGENTKQKFIEETKVIPAIKVIEIVPRISQIKHIVKNGKVLVQGVIHKQIFFVGTDDLVHHLAEDIPFSDIVLVNGAGEGMNSQDHSFIDNLVFEFDPVTGSLTQKIILVLDVKVTETSEVRVEVDETGVLIKADRIIGFGCTQKLVEETKTLPAVKIVDIDARISEMTSIVKNGKVIVQGVVHKQIFFVGTDDLVHHLSEDLPFSEMIEISPIDSEFPVEEGMDQQEHSFVENIVWEFDPTTGELTEKVIIAIGVVVTSHIQIPVAVAVPAKSSG